MIRKTFAAILVFTAVSLLCSGCSPVKEPAGAHAGNAGEASRELFAMDTFMSIVTYGDAAEEAADAAAGEIARLDSLFSVGIADSDIAVLNCEKKAAVSGETMELIERSAAISRSTDGTFEPTVYPLMEAWGFPSGNYRIPSDDELEKLLENVDVSRIRTDPASGTVSFTSAQTAIDLGGIAKGYTSARLMDLFREYGLVSAKVSLGGNIQVLGKKPDGTRWKIGIEDASGNGTLAGVIETEDSAVVTSGDYERYFEENGVRYHHILDPETGYPARSGLAGVTIISSDGTLADALSTALFVMGSEKAEEYWREHADEFDMILQKTDGTLSVSEGIEDRFTGNRETQVIRR